MEGQALLDRLQILGRDMAAEERDKQPQVLAANRREENMLPRQPKISHIDQSDIA